MAIRNEAQVTITGWLDNVKDFPWGTTAKVSVDVRKKNDATGAWETVDKTTYDVTVQGSPNLDGVRQVIVRGKIAGTQVFTKRDGTPGTSIKVRAESIVEATELTASADPGDFLAATGATAVDPSLPF